MEREADQFYIKWLLGIDDEVAFWDEWFASKGMGWPKDYLQRTSAETPFRFPGLLRAGIPEKILDVGAGPISKLGNMIDGTKLPLQACDPLAPVYDLLLEKHGIRPYVTSRFALVERLRDVYEPNSFDLVTMLNALDHSIDPVLGLHNLLAVCAINGTVFLRHNSNEAENEKYQGLHQWNICAHDGRLFFWNTEERYDIKEVFGDSVTIAIDVADNGEAVSASIKKNGEIEFSSHFMHTYDRIILQAAMLFSSPRLRSITPKNPYHTG